MNKIIDEAQSGSDAYVRTGGTLRAVALWLGAVAGAATLAAVFGPTSLAPVMWSAAGLFGLGAGVYAVQASRWRPQA